MLAKLFKRSAQKTDTLLLSGLQGQAHVDLLNKCLSTVPGVANVAISEADQQASVTYDTAQTNIDKLNDVIRVAGFAPAKLDDEADGNCCGGCTG